MSARDRDDIDAFASRDEDPPPRPRGPEHADRAALARIGGWLPSKAVEAALCNQRGEGRACSNLVGVTREALDAMVVFNRQLESRGEAPLRLDECSTCSSCASARNRAAEDRSATRRERTTFAIRQLKGLEAASDADTRAAMLWLEKQHGRGYLNDLLTAIREGQAKSSSRSRGKAGDL